MAKILVVDDLPANRALVVTLIGHSGHQAWRPQTVPRPSPWCVPSVPIW
ncbi:MAG: hypothetical protein ACLGIY_17895 [Betaproteobacteria bacterium]